MNKFYNYLLLEKNDNSNTYFYIGKFGEDLIFTKLDDAKYIFSSYVLDLWDITVDEKSKQNILDTYCLRGHDDFNIKNRSRLINRVVELHNAAYSLYKKLLETNNSTFSTPIKEIVNNVEQFELSETDYYDLFLTPDKEDRDFIEYVLLIAGRDEKTKSIKEFVKKYIKEHEELMK